VNIAETLAAWQKVGDERLFKIVLSPEFGEQVDLERLTRNVMSAIEGDVGRPHPAVRQKVHIGTFCPPAIMLYIHRLCQYQSQLVHQPFMFHYPVSLKASSYAAASRLLTD
jgi:hypothetical protein